MLRNSSKSREQKHHNKINRRTEDEVKEQSKRLFFSQFLLQTTFNGVTHIRDSNPSTKSFVDKIFVDRFLVDIN